jgi:hypothetical protein
VREVLVCVCAQRYSARRDAIKFYAPIVPRKSLYFNLTPAALLMPHIKLAVAAPLSATTRFVLRSCHQPLSIENYGRCWALSPLSTSHPLRFSKTIFCKLRGWKCFVPDWIGFLCMSSKYCRNCPTFVHFFSKQI